MPNKRNPNGKTFDANPNATKEEVLESLEKNRGMVVQTCRDTGISTATFYKWKREDEDFKAKVEELREKEGEQIYAKLIDAAMSGNLSAIIFYCKTQLHMSEKQIIQMQAENTIDISQALKDIKNDLD